MLGEKMSSIDRVGAVLSDLRSVSTAGFAIGLHLEYTTSRYIFQTYPKDWMEEYSRKGLILNDPTVRWGVENLGWIRWSKLSETDEAGVFSAAASFGLKFGVSIAVEGSGTRSLGSFAASEREFTDREVGSLRAGMEELHTLSSDIETDSQFDVELRQLAASMN